MVVRKHKHRKHGYSPSRYRSRSPSRHRSRSPRSHRSHRDHGRESRARSSRRQAARRQRYEEEEAEFEDYELVTKRSTRQRKQISYKFEDFDEAINSAINEEVEEHKKGKVANLLINS